MPAQQENNAQTKNVYLMSLGQLIASDLSKSINAFAKILERQSKFPYFTNLRIYLSFGLDKVWYHSIDNYKKGDIGHETFKERICRQIGIKASAEEFDNAWNAMCQIKDSTAENIYNILKNKQISMCVVSGTNPCQYNYITKALDDKFAELNAKTGDNISFSNNDSVKVTTSFEQKELSIVRLAKKAIEDFDRAGNNIISFFDKKVNKMVLGIKSANFSFKSKTKSHSYIEMINNDLSSLPKAEDSVAKLPELNQQKVENSQVAVQLNRREKASSAAIGR